MVQVFNREYLLNLLQTKKKHDKGAVVDVLPFLSKRTKAVREHFHTVLGEYIRNITEMKYDQKALNNKDFYITIGGNQLSDFIADDVVFKQDDDVHDFVRFIDAYLFNKEKINPIHPYFFNLIEVSKEHDNEIGKYGHFMYEVFVQNNNEIKEIFSNKESDDILTELILSKLDDLKLAEKKRKPKTHYQPLLQSFTSLYQEDVVYLSKYKDYFLTAFPILTHYYVFMYVCQLLIKFEQFTEADYEKVRPLYFALEWESLSRRRKAADDLEGFKYIKEKHIHIFPHIHTISHLSHCVFNDEKEEKEFIPYADLYALIKDKGEAFEFEFLKELKQWIQEYSQWAKISVQDDSEDIPKAFNVLFHCLKEGMSTGVCKKYGENIEDLGAQFIKTRGSLGQVLNIKHDFLLLMTAVCVKDQRMPLNDLFTEFEKRGIVFDRYSKKEIIMLFDNHNILDKKSDSGDAQYVKPIL